MRLFSAAVIVPAFFQTCLPNPPQVDPPVAHIEATCLSSDCLVMELSAAASVDADDYDWTIDGVPFGTDEVFAIDLETRGLVAVELVVTNAGGSDDDSQYLFTTTVSNDTVAEDVILAGVIAGATGCDSLSVISTVGGCFDNSGGANLEHVVGRARAGTQNVSVMVYDPVADSVVTPGFASAVIWERPTGTFSSFPAGVPRSDYGPAPRIYRNVVGPNQSHLTSYYPIATGDSLTFDLGHGAYLGDASLTPLDAVTLDCTSGALQVSSTPVN